MTDPDYEIASLRFEKIDPTTQDLECFPSAMFKAKLSFFEKIPKVYDFQIEESPDV